MYTSPNRVAQQKTHPPQPSKSGSSVGFYAVLILARPSPTGRVCIPAQRLVEGEHAAAFICSACHHSSPSCGTPPSREGRMTRIFDNIDRKLFPALINTLVSAHRADFCVGFFNLRGWGLVADQIDHFAGGEGQCCRVLIGMNERPDDELRAALGILKTDDGLDLQRAAQLRR